MKILLPILLILLAFNSKAGIDPFNVDSFEEGKFKIEELTTYNLSTIKRKLQTDLGVVIGSDNGEIFDRYFLSYLYEYFQGISLDHRVILNSSIDIGPRLVKEEGYSSLLGGKNLVFSKNAPDKIFSKKLNEVIGAYIEARITSADSVKLTFEYNNELLSQLNKIFVTRAFIEDYLVKELGISLAGDINDKELDFISYFSDDELQMVFKQLMEIPSHVRKALALKRIVRMQYGYALADNALANYNKGTETLKISSAAFDNDSEGNGEGTFLHELGHALWKVLPDEDYKEEFLDHSWEKIGEKWVIKKGATNFVSTYAMGGSKGDEFEEDFAESFSAYIDRSEYLQKKTLDKYEWLRDKIFLNTEYFADAAANVKAVIESENEDVRGPQMGALNASSFKIEHAITKEGKLKIRYEVRGVFDDLSGVKEIFVNLSTSQGSFLGGFLNQSHLVDVENGIYVLEEEYDVQNLSDDTYSLLYLTLTDNTGNDTSYAGHNFSDFIGFKLENSNQKSIDDELQFSAEEIAVGVKHELLSLHEKSGSVFRVDIPIVIHEALDNVRLYYRGMNTNKKLTYLRLRSSFENKAVGESISMKLIIPGEVPSDFYKLEGLEITFGTENKDYKKSRKFISLKDKLNNNLFIEHRAVDEDKTIPEILVNEIKFEVKDGVNSKGGEKTINLLIPVSGSDAGQGEMRVYVRTPQGDRISHNGYNDLSEKAFAEGKNGASMTEIDGVKYYVYPIELGPNHHGGEYIITDVKYGEIYKKDDSVPYEIGWPIDGNGHQVEERLLQRGIRKTIEVQIDQPPMMERRVEIAR